MYSVVLATMLTAGSTSPAWHSTNHCTYWYSGHACYSGYSGHHWYPGYRLFHGFHHHHCHSCYSGYSGYASYSCYAGYGCWSRCSSCCSTYVYHGCSVCSGCTTVYTHGCCGGVAVSPQSPRVVPVPSANSEIDALRKEVEMLRKKLSEKVPGPGGKKEEEVSVPATAVSRVTVTLPSDARLWIDNVECPLTSSVRSFNTPALNTNQSYAYNLTMEVMRNGQPMRESQRVLIIPGQEVRVNFNGTATASR
jgi:uncharacterized protein (TIGR03000 family)